MQTSVGGNQIWFSLHLVGRLQSKMREVQDEASRQIKMTTSQSIRVRMRQNALGGYVKPMKSIPNDGTT